MAVDNREAQIKKLFEDYMLAFAQMRYEDIGQMFSFPTLLCQPDKVTEIASGEVVIALMQHLRTTLADDYATTNILRNEVTMLDGSLGALHGIYDRRNAEGEVTSRGQGLYLMRQDGPEWKMCSVTVMDTPEAQ